MVMMKLDSRAQKDHREVHICLPKMVTGSRQHNEPGRCYYLWLCASISVFDISVICLCGCQCGPDVWHIHKDMLKYWACLSHTVCLHLSDSVCMICVTFTPFSIPLRWRHCLHQWHLRARHHTRRRGQAFPIRADRSECHPCALSGLPTALRSRGPQRRREHLPDPHWPRAPSPGGERPQQLRPLPGVSVAELPAACSGSSPGRSPPPRGHTSGWLVAAAHHAWIGISAHSSRRQHLHGLLREHRRCRGNSTRGRASDSHNGERGRGVWIHHCWQSNWSASETGSWIMIIIPFFHWVVIILKWHVSDLFDGLFYGDSGSRYVLSRVISH